MKNQDTIENTAAVSVGSDALVSPLMEIAPGIWQPARPVAMHYPWPMRWLRRVSGLAQFDQETADTLHPGCHVAEEQAAIRYGDNWRAEYSARRSTERRAKWPLLSRW